MKGKYWKILLLLALIVGAVLITREIAKANSDDEATTPGAKDGTLTGVDQKILGSMQTAPFASQVKLYANADNLRIRKTASLTGDVLKTVNAGTYLGMTTGTEKTADSNYWVEIKQADDSLAYVAKNYTYIIV